MKLHSEALALIVTVISGVLIGLVYAFILPALFPGYGTWWILILGVFVATLIGGYIGYHIPSADKLLVKIALGLSYAAVVAIFVSFISLFIIVNVRGE